KLAALRDEGIMLVASGNVVHNLRTVKWHGDSSPYPWAMSFNDMVEYFGEHLDGFVFTQNGWVQSYGSRCVKPPIVIGDVSRP
ncbi:hypothetical protein, partial [Escherichia coli]|uniref:hypothetical protein n=1 Tax=Escherichia coli TaxID=562 RepID=UPI00207718F3